MHLQVNRVYNNFYKFGLDKAEPTANAGGLRTEGWKIQIEGEIGRPVMLDIDDIIKIFRCVEAWSMVIPWVGFPLAKLIQFVEPTSAARYVAFQTLHDPEQMPWQKDRFLAGGLDCTYVEGLTMEEAPHPLTLLALGFTAKPCHNRTAPPSVW